MDLESARTRAQATLMVLFSIARSNAFTKLDRAKKHNVYYAIWSIVPFGPTATGSRDCERSRGIAGCLGLARSFGAGG